MATATTSLKTLADLLRRLGDVPPDRVRLTPPPGTATVQDVIAIEGQEGRLCELIDGVLLEKCMGYGESALTGLLLALLHLYNGPRNLGIVTGPDGMIELMPDLVRIPDIALVRWERLPSRRRPSSPVPQLVPNLAVEVLSRSNTLGEMAAKRHDYFAAGVELVWEIDPDARTVTVYSSLTDLLKLSAAETLDGGTVLPGFSIPLAQLFAELDRQG